jgi:flagellar basal-body rod protein FlgB
VISNQIFNHNSVIESSMQASMLRNQVIQNNIANVDTPGFKRRTVSFENDLLNELQAAERGNRSVNLNKVSPQIVFENEGFRYRLDENNVDIELEMVELYKNSIRFDAMANNVIVNYQRINSVITTR